jgi:hypothetical protein
MLVLRRRHFAFVPSGSCKRLLFDYLVGAGEQGRGNGEAERLGGLEVDRQLVVHWRLHPTVGRLFALQNAIHIGCGATELVDDIRSIGD